MRRSSWLNIGCIILLSAAVLLYFNDLLWLSLACVSLGAVLGVAAGRASRAGDDDRATEKALPLRRGRVEPLAACPDELTRAACLPGVLVVALGEGKRSRTLAIEAARAGVIARINDCQSTIASSFKA